MGETPNASDRLRTDARGRCVTREGVMRAAKSTALWTVLAAAISVATAQDESPQVRVARLIPLLGSRTYAERHLATEELQRLGPAAREQLQKQIDSADPEIRRGARELLEKLRLADLWE